MKFKVEGDRTVLILEKNESYIIKDFAINSLEKDLEKEGLARETRRAINNEIERGASGFLNRIGEVCKIDFLKKDHHEMFHYQGSGIVVVHLKNVIAKYNPIPSIVNIQKKGTENPSIQIGFWGRDVIDSPLSDLLKIYSTLIGKYQLSYGHMRNSGETDLIVNPINEAENFIRDVGKADYLLEESGLWGELRELRGKKINDLVFDDILKGRYAQNLLKVLSVK